MTSDGSLSFGVFFTAATVLALTPGPGVLYVMARTVAGGRQDGVASTLGTSIGGLVHVVLLVLGIAAVSARRR